MRKSSFYFPALQRVNLEFDSVSHTHTKLLALEKCDWLVFECSYFFFSVLALVVSHSCECGHCPLWYQISLISRTECFCTHFLKCRTLVKWFLYIMGPFNHWRNVKIMALRGKRSESLWHFGNTGVNFFFVYSFLMNVFRIWWSEAYFLIAIKSY